MFLLSLLACAPMGAPAPADEPVLEIRTYTVPESTAERMEGVLGRLLNVGGTYVGSVQRGPGGDLYVLAPATVHEGVEDVVAAAGEAAPPEVANLRFDYWIVRAEPAETASFGDGLTSVKPALSELPPAAFTLESQQSLTSRDGQSSKLQASNLVIEQVASLDPDGGIRAWIDLEQERQDGWHQVETTVQLDAGQTLVLAANGSDGQTLYTILRPATL